MDTNFGWAVNLNSTQQTNIRKATHTMGRVSIWLSNQDPRGDKGADIEWLEGNCQFVQLCTPIVRANTE